MIPDIKRRKQGSADRPWVAIAMVAGILIVMASMAIWYFAGSPLPGDSHPAGAASQPPAAGAVKNVPGEITYGVAPDITYELTDVAVPEKGVFIKVIYRGAYKGTYSSGNETHDVHNSGERIFAVENAGPFVEVIMKKTDNSSRQVLTIEIWHDGTRIAANATSLPHGEVTVSGTLA